MGTYANTNPKVEQITCDLLGLKLIQQVRRLYRETDMQNMCKLLH